MSGRGVVVSAANGCAGTPTTCWMRIDVGVSSPDAPPLDGVAALDAIGVTYGSGHSGGATVGGSGVSSAGLAGVAVTAYWVLDGTRTSVVVMVAVGWPAGPEHATVPAS